jgi:hypothetical protein
VRMSRAAVHDLMFTGGTAARDGELVCSLRKGGKTMRLHIKGGYGQKHIDLLALIMLAAMVSVVGSGILYLGERIHAPAQTRMILTGPVPPL